MKRSITKRLLSFVLAIGVLFTLIPAILVSAETSVKIAKITQTHYRIRHVASGKYLGIDPDGLEQNGARLQIQDYQDRWNDFKKAAKEYTALRIEVSYDFEMVWIDLPWPVLNTIVKVRYYGWDGSPDSINRDIGINGSWEYIFK